MIPLAPSLDTVGLLTRNTADLLPVAKMIVADWHKSKKKKQNRTLGVPIGAYLQQADKAVLRRFEKTIKQLAEHGYTIIKYPMFADIAQINQAIWNLASYEMARAHHYWYAQYKRLYRPKTQQFIEKGQQMRSEERKELKEKQVELRELVRKTMQEEQIDLWISPAASSYPPKTLTSTGNPAMNIPWTFAGLPSISLPIKPSEPLPLGLQVVGKYAKDEALLQESIQIERIISNE